MDNFLEETVKDILENNEDLSRLIFVIPNNRAALFLKDAIKKNATKSLILPQIKTISEFIAEISGLSQVDPLISLFEFYECYRENVTLSENETFLDFIKWGRTVINDFNEIDNHLVNPKKILSHINEAYALEVWSPDQTTLTNFQKKYIKLWAELGPLYEQFSKKLLKHNKGYSGLLKRTALDNLNQGSWSEDSFVHFIGLSALTKSEEEILKWFVKNEKATVHWDVDEFYLLNKEHEAGTFIRRYYNNSTLRKTFTKIHKFYKNKEKHII